MHAVKTGEGIAVVTLDRGKVNALDPATITGLREQWSELAGDRDVRAVVLTGRGKFFSFGFDIPEFLSYSREDFRRFVVQFTECYRQLFALPKPVIAALNGHTIAGGCMLALACDRRVMATGRARIALNEVAFGSSVFAGCVEMLVGCVGQRVAQEILYSGAMLPAEEARGLRLVDLIAGPEQVLQEAMNLATSLAEADPVAFASVKKLLRGPIAEQMQRREAESIEEFIDIWYSETTRRQLDRITIRN